MTPHKLGNILIRFFNVGSAGRNQQTVHTYVGHSPLPPLFLTILNKTECMTRISVLKNPKIVFLRLLQTSKLRYPMIADILTATNMIMFVKNCHAAKKLPNKE